MRRDIHVEPSTVRRAAHEMSSLQKAGAENHFRFQHAAQT